MKPTLNLIVFSIAHPIRTGRFATLALFLLSALVLGAENSAPTVAVGVGQIDITPDYPIRLSGFGFRRTESEGISARIWAKALAFTDPKEGPAILITTDNLCVPDAITQEIGRRLAAKAGIKIERLTITSTHTHTAPMLKGICPTLFGVPIPPEHQAHIDRYYSLCLKEQFDHRRLWVNGYANDARCYIPSERVLKEGGYEGGDAMIYYDIPQRFAPGLEQKIIDAVTKQIPPSFAAPKGTEGSRPLSASESLGRCVSDQD